MKTYKKSVLEFLPLLCMHVFMLTMRLQQFVGLQTCATVLLSDMYSGQAHVYSWEPWKASGPIILTGILMNLFMRFHIYTKFLFISQSCEFDKQKSHKKSTSIQGKSPNHNNPTHTCSDTESKLERKMMPHMTKTNIYIYILYLQI